MSKKAMTPASPIQILYEMKMIPRKKSRVINDNVNFLSVENIPIPFSKVKKHFDYPIAKVFLIH